MDLKTQLAESMQAELPALSFRSAIEHLLKEGADRESLRKQLESLRQEVNEKQQEDVILEVLDFMGDWCHPDMRL